MPGIFCLALFILLVFTSSQCERDDAPIFEDFIFVLPSFSINPSDSIITKGDTLWLIADIPDTLFELNSGRYYQIQKPFLVSSIVARRLITKELYYSQQPGAIASFDFINKLGSIGNLSETFGTLKLEWINNHYRVLIGILPTRVGVYSISLLNPEEFDLSSINLGFSTDGRKRIPVYRHIYYSINNGNTNFELFRKHCRAVSVDFPTVGNIFYEQRSTFTFRVVE